MGLWEMTGDEQQGLDSLVTVEGERFDPRKVEERIAAVPVGKEELVYQGMVAMAEVDIFNSSGLTQILHSHNVSNQMITAEIENLHAMVDTHGGYWWRSEGDAVKFITPDLESAIRCTVEIMRWADRHLTEFVKDYVIASEVLRDGGVLGNDPTANDRVVRREVASLRKIKEVWAGSLPPHSRGRKMNY